MVPLVYESAVRFSEGLAAVKSKGKWGFVNAKGKVVVKPEYDTVFDFLGGRAGGVIGDECTVIDSGGKRLAPLEPYAGITE